jgi:hypothetical protein
MAQAVSYWPLTWKPRFVHWSVHVGFVVKKVALGQVIVQFSPVSIIPP